MAGNPRQDLYLEISRNLLQEELRDLRNYVSGAKILPAGVVQNATAQEIFNQLEKEWNLKSGDLSLMADLLTKIGRNDYAEQAEEIAENERNLQGELTPRHEPTQRLVRRSGGSWHRKRRSENYEQGYAPAAASGRRRAPFGHSRQNVNREDDYAPARKRPRQDPNKPRQDPFVLQMKQSIVKRCQGCKQEFGELIPPANLVIQHYDNYPYFDKWELSDFDSWRNGYFHANVACIKPRYRDFDPHEVVVPPSTLENLTDDHVEYCREHGILLSVPWET